MSFPLNKRIIYTPRRYSEILTPNNHSRAKANENDISVENPNADLIGLGDEPK
jgi:hypothetical protein